MNYHADYNINLIQTRPRLSRSSLCIILCHFLSVRKSQDPVVCQRAIGGPTVLPASKGGGPTVHSPLSAIGVWMVSTEIPSSLCRDFKIVDIPMLLCARDCNKMEEKQGGQQEEISKEGTDNNDLRNSKNASKDSVEPREEREGFLDDIAIESTDSEGVDTDRFSRIVAFMGAGTLKQLMSLKVLICGKIFYFLLMYLGLFLARNLFFRFAFLSSFLVFLGRFFSTNKKLNRL